MTRSGSLGKEQAWHRRLHAALMPDYNPAATLYWWLAAIGGGLLLLWCQLEVALLPPLGMLHVAVGIVLAVSAGLFPVRIPGTKVSFAAGEVCIFLVLLLQGPAAAAVVAAGEAAMASYRTSRRWTSRLGSPAMATLAMYTAGQAFAAGQANLVARHLDHPASLLALAMVVGSLYFLLSATLMGGTARLRRGENLLQMSDVIGAFRWVGLAYAASAVVSTLLFIVHKQAGYGVFAVMLPLLAMLLLVLHFYYRQQEAQQALRVALADAAERETAMHAREAELTSRHVRELQLAERRFRSAFTYASIGMALLDLEGSVIQANEALGRLLERPADELSHLLFSAFLHPADRPTFLGRLATAHGVDFEDFDQELRLVSMRGMAHAVRVHCSFFRGPAAHGSAQAGRPCLILQIQTAAPMAGEGPMH